MLTQSEFLKGRQSASISVPSQCPGRMQCYVFYHQETLLQRAQQNEKCLKEGPVKRNAEMQLLCYGDHLQTAPCALKTFQ